VQWRCARAIGTGERAHGEPCRVTSIFSLWASNSVPMPTIGERNVRAGTTDIASDAKGTSSLRWEKAFAGASPSEASSRKLRTSGAGTNVPGYSTFKAVLCEHHESGISMCRVSASVVRVVGCRPSTMDSTISGARKAKRIKRPT
jgi:hypothetical protein